MKPLAEHVKPALAAVARRNKETYFLKREIVLEVLRRADIADDVIAIRRDYRGKGLDEAILTFVETQVGVALRQRDHNGLRVYESYIVDGGEHRWQRFRSMKPAELRSVIRTLEKLKQHLDEKVRAYSIILAELDRDGGTVEDVYDRAWMRILTSGIETDRLSA